ncbi:MAG: hypothetical protein WA052_00975 [Microgenomates group bacterium]
MTKTNFSLKFVIIFLFFALLASPALAQTEKGKENGINRRNPSPQALVTTAKANSCQARESGVKTRMAQLTKLSINMETTFDRIAEKVKAYYTETVLPSGKSVANYDALVADIAAKKAIVQTELADADTDIKSFSCISGEPKTLMNQYQVNMRAVKTALKNYRTSIVNLIVAVRTVSKDIEATPTVTVTPSPTI